MVASSPSWALNVMMAAQGCPSGVMYDQERSSA
jgi:hypothetical protein